MSRSEQKTMYFNMYMTYTNSHTTLEDIGIKYNLSKQRIWQIIRYSKLGEGNYYKGLKVYNKVYKSFKDEYTDADAKTLNALMRDWMQLKKIRLIKTK